MGCERQACRAPAEHPGADQAPGQGSEHDDQLWQVILQTTGVVRREAAPPVPPRDVGPPTAPKPSIHDVMLRRKNVPNLSRALRTRPARVDHESLGWGRASHRPPQAQLVLTLSSLSAALVDRASIEVLTNIRIMVFPFRISPVAARYPAEHGCRPRPSVRYG